MYKANIRLQKFILIIGIVLMGAKFTAWIMTNSNAVLTDALESCINVAAGAFTLYGLILSSKPRDLNHPYGHGKVEFIAATVEGVLIASAGLSMIIKASYNFFYANPLKKLDIGIWLVVAAGIINYIIGTVTEKRGVKSGSVALMAGGKHLKSDAYSTAGLVVGLLIIYFTQFAFLDNVIAIFFGILICVTGYKIIRTSVAGIMDEADKELLESVVSLLNEKRRMNWMDIHNLRIIKYGPSFHIDCHLTVPYYFDVRQAHQESYEIEKIISERYPNNIELFIHTDACVPPFSCRICIKEDCVVREALLSEKIEWHLENVMSNQKHGMPSEKA